MLLVEDTAWATGNSRDDERAADTVDSAVEGVEQVILVLAWKLTMSPYDFHTL